MLASLLETASLLSHPYLIGELASGSLARRDIVLNSSRRLPRVNLARDQALFGIEYVDAHVLAATRLIPGVTFWTRGRRLLAAAEKLSLAARLSHRLRAGPKNLPRLAGGDRTAQLQRR